MAIEKRVLEHYLSKIADLPSFPAVVTQLMKLIDNPLTSSNKIEELIMTDQGLALKTLRMANSAFYAIPGGAKTINRAITFLGFASLREMVMASTLFQLLESKDSQAFDLKKHWHHSVVTGSIARLLSREFDLGREDDAFLCGLVHDLGRVLLNMVDPASLAQVQKLADDDCIPFEEAEKRLEAPRHTDIGLLVAKKWNLPRVIQCSIHDHHTEKLTIRESSEPDINKVVDAVFLSNCIAANRMSSKDSSRKLYEYSPEIMARNQIKLIDLEKLEPKIDEAVSKAESLVKSMFGP